MSAQVAPDRFVDVRGARLRVSVRRSNSSGELPLLLIGGIGVSLEVWEPLRTALADLQTIAFDLPGVGESSPPTRLRRMRGLAGLVCELLDRLDLPRVDVLGVSWGGGLAQQLARQAPQRVRRLVLAATTFGLGAMPARPSVLTTLASPRRFRSRTYLERVAPRLYGGEARVDGSAVRLLVESNTPPTLRGYFAQLWAVSGWTSLPWLHRLTQPTLVLAGDDDPIVPLVNARVLARLIPNARLHVVPGGGHLFALARSDEIAPAVRAFLREDDRLEDALEGRQTT